MTQVDFYILPESSEAARLNLACRLADKAVHRRLGVFLLAADADDARRLDELLWTFAQNSFLPHRLAWEAGSDPVEEPILIGCPEHPAPATVDAADPPSWGLMINLSGDVPSSFERYERLAEVVDSEPARREAGRERYRYYRDRGYELKTHRLQR